MIDLTNRQDLTIQERRDILQRAIYSQPFFYFMPFELTAEVLADNPKVNQYKAKASISKDFWLTEVKANFSDALKKTNSLFDLNIWTAITNDSLFKFGKANVLPSAFQTTDCRFNTPFVDQRFDDRQHELCAWRIKAGDSVLANIKNVSQKIAIADATVVLAGYYTVETNYVPERVTQGINESLADDVKFELWSFDVTHAGKKAYNLSNDRFARLVLGFGIVDFETDKGLTSESTVLIRDTSRGLEFNSEPIPVEFFAPRLTCLRDAHIYYLPLEYLFQPFANLKFEIFNTLNGGTGYQFVMLTRTV